MVTGSFSSHRLKTEVCITLIIIISAQSLAHSKTNHKPSAKPKEVELEIKIIPAGKVNQKTGGQIFRRDVKHQEGLKRKDVELGRQKKREDKNARKRHVDTKLPQELKGNEYSPPGTLEMAVGNISLHHGEAKEVHANHAWSYTGANGPAFWKESYPKCGGQNQSPINIASEKTYPAADLGPITFSADYSKVPIGGQWSIKNNGHSVTVIPTSGKYTIAGKGLPGNFKLAQFHFHWGSNSEQGSEHTLNGKCYPLEAHFVHYNTKYKDASKAMNKSDGLAVLGFFFQISEAENEGLKAITHKLPDVATAGNQSPVDAMNLNKIIGNGFAMDKFYRYSGSLTTPGCFESVTWTIFSQPRNMSAKQLEEFRKLKSSTYLPLVNNFRPVQFVNNRQIQRSFEEHCHFALKGDHSWGYGEESGPDQWSNMFPKCGGRRQSPINIVTKTALAMSMLTPLEFSDDYFHYPVGSWKVYNSGHSLVIEPTTGNLLLSEGALPGTYKLAQIAFHWGTDEELGSEHTIDGQRHAMEMHLIHYNTRDKSFEDAKHRKDGLAILAFFFELGRFGNTDLKPTVKEIPTLGNTTTKASIPSINLMHLMGGKGSLKEYYRYEGSMTTPPCEESVVWTVFVRRLEISEFQLKKFQSLINHGKRIHQNFRPIQASNNRLVSRSEFVKDR